jgi:two-component system chemotaxis sensor kinase CheA
MIKEQPLSVKKGGNRMAQQQLAQKGQELACLVEQAACCVNMLSPSDISEAPKLHEVLSRIAQDAAQTADGTQQDELLQQFNSKTQEAVEQLEGILRRDVQDTAQALDNVSKAISMLQNMIGRMEQPKAACQDEESSSLTMPGAKPQGEGSICAVVIGPDSGMQAGQAADAKTPTIAQDDIPLVLDFIAEANEHIETAEASVLELETKPDDKELVNKIFRAFHTIKGTAGFLNLVEIGSLAHSAENLLDLARKDKLVLAGQSSDVVFESIDMMKKMLAELKTSVEAGKSIPSQDRLPRVLARLKAASEGQALAVSLNAPDAKKTDTVLDTILQDSSAVQKKESAAEASTYLSDEKIKVSTTRLEKLVNMTGELVIAHLMVSEQVSGSPVSEHELVHKVSHQGKIVRELQELSMSMRMVPIQGVFQKMARLARDLAHKAGKEVTFVTAGEETELDRTIVDKIADPLVHMVRNALDHGIEPPEERVKTGKSAAGLLALRAFHQAGNIVIEIEDDGKGLDKERILKKAIGNGLVEAGQQLSEEEVFALIFHAGLSTAEKVTSVSGRGVGMDVVKKNVESLRGKIDISSQQGKGTKFTIRLPLTLAVIDGQVVRVGQERFIIPIGSIVRTLRPTAGQIASVQTRGHVLVERGELIPLVRLHKLFDISSTIENAIQGLLVIVEEDGKKCCFLVDDLLSQQQVVIKSLGDGLGRVKGISGSAIMGDGRVSLIFDVPGLIALAQNR